MKQKKKLLTLALCLLALFLLWTAVVRGVDVQAVGPQGSKVGFAALNTWFHRLTGEHMALYTLTDWLSLLPLGIAAGFGVLGFVQWIKRKALRKVDGSILVLGGFYAVVLAVYALFEVVVINYRPVLIEGVLEASYPSSTTVLVLCILPAAALQLRERIQNPTLRRVLVAALLLFAALMVLGRLLSGVHWLTDIVGGMLLSGGLVALYACFAEQ